MKTNGVFLFFQHTLQLIGCELFIDIRFYRGYESSRLAQIKT